MSIDNPDEPIGQVNGTPEAAPILNPSADANETPTVLPPPVKKPKVTPIMINNGTHNIPAVEINNGTHVIKTTKINNGTHEIPAS